MVAILIILAAIAIGGAITLTVAGLPTSQDTEDFLLRFLTNRAKYGEVTSLEEIELSQPFHVRVIIPFLRRVGNFTTWFTPQRVIQETNTKLEQAGSLTHIDAATFLASRFVVAGLFGGFMVLIAFISPNPWPFCTLLVTLIFTAIGFFFPQLWLKSKIQCRQKDVRNAMPDALDLLTMCVEAGLGFEAAMSKVSEKWENELSLAFMRAIREIELGKTRRDALRDMAERIGIPEMTSFATIVIQSEMLGVSLAKVLRIQSEQMRIQRRLSLENDGRRLATTQIALFAILIPPIIVLWLLSPILAQFLP